MPAPSVANVTLRPDLGTLHEFDLDMQRQNYVGLQIMPRFDVARQSGKFGRIPIEQLLAAGDERLERAAATGFSRMEWKFEDESFSTDERGVEEPIDDREAELYADYFDAEQVAATRAIERLFAGYERRVLKVAIDQSVSDSRTTAAGTPWTSNNATPRDDVKTASRAIFERTGMWPNTLVINRYTMQNLQDCIQIIERLTSSGAGQSGTARAINAQALAQFFDIDRVLVADAIKTSTGGSIAPLFPTDSALLLKAATDNDIRTPCFGRTLVYTGVTGDFEGFPESYREESIASTVIRARHESDEKVLYPEMAQVIEIGAAD